MTGEPLIRRGTPEDAEACHEVMWASVTDLGTRRGTPLQGSVAEWWAGNASLQNFLAAHAAEWWVAEEARAGSLIGYARSIERGGLLELTEFFVVPASQSAGVGRALLERAFPLGRGETRSIIATMDVRALSRYFRAGTVARFPMLSLAGAPSETEMNSDLTPQAVDAGSVDDRRDLAAIDRSVLEYAREEAALYRRDGQSVGFAFVGKSGAGPVAVLDATDLPAILLHVESRAVAAGIEQLEFQVPSPNDVATHHLLSRGFRLDPWLNLLLSSRPFGHFDRLVCFGPPLFL